MKHGWTYKPLGEVITVKSGYTPNASELSNEGDIPYFKVAEMNLPRNEKYLYDTPQFVISPKSTFPKGSIVFPKNGAAIGTNKKRILVTPSVVDLNTAVAIPNSEIESNFLYYIFQKIDFRLITRRGTVPTLDLKELKNITIPVPSKDEQISICSLLDKMNRVIEAKKEQLKELDNLAQAIFYDMFGDPVTNEKGWNIIALNDAVHSECPISYGIVQPEEDVKGGVPIVRPIDFRENTYVKRDGLKCTSLEISNAYKRTILRGDELLFCVRGTTGTIGIATRELKGCNVTRGIVPLFFCEKVKRAFAYYVLLHPSTQQLIQEKTNGIALRQINIKDLRSLPIITPSPTLQQAFAEKVEAIERQKELINQSLREVQTLFDSRMDYWFSEENDDLGQLDKLD